MAEPPSGGSVVSGFRAKKIVLALGVTSMAEGLYSEIVSRHPVSVFVLTWAVYELVRVGSEGLTHSQDARMQGAVGVEVFGSLITSARCGRGSDVR